MIILHNELLKNHTTLKTGGPADVFCQPESIEEACTLITDCEKKGDNYFILGNGSNLCVSDEGFRGTVIDLSKNLTEINVSSGDDGVIQVVAQAGVMLSRIGQLALSKELTGFEALSGIPGTVGGGVVMNAGAYGSEIKDVIEWAKVLDPKEGVVKELKADELSLGYRTSIIQSKGYVVLEAAFNLHKGNSEEIKALMQDYATRRRDKQPLEYPSAGSTFKRPEGYFAGKLIEDSGLKGFKVGGMEVSTKHAGFVVNSDNGTAKDFFELTDKVKEVVLEKYGVTLELEVKCI